MITHDDDAGDGATSETDGEDLVLAQGRRREAARAVDADAELAARLRLAGTVLNVGHAALEPTSDAKVNIKERVMKAKRKP